MSPQYSIIWGIDIWGQFSCFSHKQHLLASVAGGTQHNTQRAARTFEPMMPFLGDLIKYLNVSAAPGSHSFHRKKVLEDKEKMLRVTLTISKNIVGSDMEEEVPLFYIHARVCAHACVCACVCACVSACVHMCVFECVVLLMTHSTTVWRRHSLPRC